MRTNLDLISNSTDSSDISRIDFIGYHHPREIVADPELTVARKRALLARWLSDANALVGSPTIRRSPAGATASVDQLRQSLDKLDEMVEAIAMSQLNSRGMTA